MSIKNIDDNTYPVSPTEIITKEEIVTLVVGPEQINITLNYTQIGNLVSFQLSQFSLTNLDMNEFKIQFPSSFPNIIDTVYSETQCNYMYTTWFRALFTLTGKQGIINRLDNSYVPVLFPSGEITVLSIKGYGYLTAI